MSPAFQADHPLLCCVVRAACAKRASRWKLIGSKNAYQEALRKVTTDRPARQRRPLDVIALLVPAEKSSQDPRIIATFQLHLNFQVDFVVSAGDALSQNRFGVLVGLG